MNNNHGQSIASLQVCISHLSKSIYIHLYAYVYIHIHILFMQTVLLSRGIDGLFLLAIFRLDANCITASTVS
jgi:hypothetical protein